MIIRKTHAPNYCQKYQINFKKKGEKLREDKKMTLEEFENLDDGWVEWPSFPENENLFDWSLSYEEMDRLYNPARKGKVRRFDYKSSTPFPKPVETKREESIKAAHYVNYMGKDCPCVGFIDRAFSITGVAGVKQYENAYYHSGEEKYLFRAHHGILAYPKDKVEKYIKPFFPDQEKKIIPPKPIPNKIKDMCADVKLSVNTNLSKHHNKMSDGYQEFLATQTPEQFELTKLHGWKIARILTTPQENFHEE